VACWSIRVFWEEEEELQAGPILRKLLIIIIIIIIVVVMNQFSREAIPRRWWRRRSPSGLLVQSTSISVLINTFRQIQHMYRISLILRAPPEATMSSASSAG
jgi:hypothetical protein